MLAADVFVQGREHQFEPIGVALRLLEVGLERLAQLRPGGRPRQLRQCLGQLSLGVVRVAQFVDECLVERSCFSHGSASLSM
jgi:hypothetical protein